MSDNAPAGTQTRVCRSCSAASTSEGDFCPSCGSRYMRRSRRPSRKIVLIGIAVALLLACGGVAVGVRQHQDTAARDRADAAAARQERRAANAQEEAEEAERSARRDVVTALEERITTDAKEKVDEDLLDGPIEYSSCTATGGGSTDDLTALTGTFECIAVNKENSDGTASGYRYAGTAEWGTGSITWKLGG